jgi:hypothetical protein
MYSTRKESFIAAAGMLIKILKVSRGIVRNAWAKKTKMILHPRKHHMGYLFLMVFSYI